GAQSDADGHTEDGHEEQQPEEQSPEHAPDGAASHRMVSCRDVELPLLVTDDGGDGVGLDDEILGQALCLRFSRRGGCFVGIADGNQVCHYWSCLLASVGW